MSVLHALRVKGVASPDRIAAALGAELAPVEAECKRLVTQALCKETPHGLQLLDPGRARIDALIAEERAGLDAAALGALLDEFGPLDLDLKRVVSAWQVDDTGAPNEHRDFAYDRRVLRRLGSVHSRSCDLLERIERHTPRLARYRVRLEEAHRHVSNGRNEYVCRPGIDSYHTIWFELHEELLALTGRRRREREA
jgi:pyruvate,orthophosphate dikinase